MSTATPATDYRDLRGSRVRVSLHSDDPGKTEPEELFAVLRFINPKGEPVIAHEITGVERVLPAGTVIERAMHKCGKCLTEVNRVFGNPALCADCERSRAAYDQRANKVYETCQECGAKGAIYSPLARDFYCAQCHAKNGTLAGNTVEARTLEDMTTCRGSDIKDAKHDWIPVKGGRWRCRGCQTDRYTRE